jgi:hypothetical protein
MSIVSSFFISFFSVVVFTSVPNPLISNSSLMF